MPKTKKEAPWQRKAGTEASQSTRGPTEGLWRWDRKQLDTLSRAFMAGVQ